MGTSQSTPTDQTVPNEPNQGFVSDLFYYPPLSMPTDQTPNRPVQGYSQDPFASLPLNTPTYQPPNGPIRDFVQDLFYYPSLSTPIDHTHNRSVQGYLQDPFNYPPLSAPTHQTPNGPVQGFMHDLFYYPPQNKPTEQTPNRPVQDYLQDPFSYPPLSIPTDRQTPGGPIQGRYLRGPSNPRPLVRTFDPKKKCISCGRLKYMQPATNLGDGRHLCPDCLPISAMEPSQLEPIIRQVHSFFDDHLKLPVKKDIPIFFIDSKEMGKYDGNPFDQGLTLLDDKARIKIVERCVRRGAHMEVVTKKKEVKRDKVVAILLLFGFPNPVVRHPSRPFRHSMVQISSRQWTTQIDKGYVGMKSGPLFDEMNNSNAAVMPFPLFQLVLGATLAHEMGHALIKLQGWPFILERKVEEGICEAIAYEWLKYTVPKYDPSYTQKEAAIAEWLRIKDMTAIKTGRYAAEFGEAHRAIKKYGLKCTLKHVARWRNIPE